MSENWHVYPENDLREHNTDSPECWCGPKLEDVFEEGAFCGTVITHNSMDRREEYEEGRKLS